MVRQLGLVDADAPLVLMCERVREQEEDGERGHHGQPDVLTVRNRALNPFFRVESGYKK